MGFLRFAAQAAYGTMHVAGMPGLIRNKTKDETIILMYHGFTDEPEDETQGLFNYHGKQMAQWRFEQQLKYLSQYHTIISLEDYHTHRKQGKPLPENSVILSIDDGYESIYTIAYPLLKKYNAPACVFLTTQFIDTKKLLWVDRLEYVMGHAAAGTYIAQYGAHTLRFTLGSRSNRISENDRLRAFLKSCTQKERFALVEHIEKVTSTAIKKSTHFNPLSWKQINEMKQSGLVSFGAHTLNHTVLTTCPLKVAQKEMVESKARIEKMTKGKCKFFSYPNGKYNSKIHTLAQKHFDCTLSTEKGFNTSTTDLHTLKRFNVRNAGDLSEFTMTLYGVIDKIVNTIKGVN